MLFREWDEAQTRRPCDRFDGQAPIGAFLHHGSGNGIVGARLVPVSLRPGRSKQLVDQDPGSRALVAVDHQASGIVQRTAQGIAACSAFEATVTGTKDDALHAAPARHQFQAVAEEHGGQLSLSNRPEGGCEARLQLPLAVPVENSTHES